MNALSGESTKTTDLLSFSPHKKENTSSQGFFPFLLDTLSLITKDIVDVTGRIAAKVNRWSYQFLPPDCDEFCYMNLLIWDIFLISCFAVINL